MTDGTERDKHISAILIGRGDDCLFRIDNPKISRHHALLTPQPDGTFMLQDIGSRNGTFLRNGGERISSSPVQQNSTIYFADQAVNIADITAKSGFLPHKGAAARSPHQANLTRIGRDSRNEISLHDHSISRFHAEIRHMPDGSWVIYDCQSVNGTLVNGKRIKFANLDAEDTVQLGKYSFKAKQLFERKIGDYRKLNQTGSDLKLSPSLIKIGIFSIIIGFIWLSFHNGWVYDLFPKKGSQTSEMIEDRADVSELTPSEVIALLEQSTVMVFQANGMGSGFFISEDTILTNQHVIGGADKIFITNHHTNGLHSAKLISSDNKNGRDYAVLRVKRGLGIKPLSFNPKIGRADQVSSWGFPADVVISDPKFLKLLRGDLVSVPEVVYSSGVVGAVHEGAPQKIAHSADISTGNSGGPLVNTAGHVIGINSYMIGSADFALGATDIMDFLKENGLRYTAVK